MFMLNRPAMMDPNNYADPGHYDPDRWLHDHRHESASERGAHEPRAYLQFGAGPRVCPGRHLAAVEMRLVVSMLTANFTARLATNPADIREICTFTAVPSAMPMRLAVR
jgi:cytochrome P450